MIPKPTRVVDLELIKFVKTLPCICCRPGTQTTPTDPDHLTTRGAGGGDTVDNLMPLCRMHHSERHQIGILTFGAKYPTVQEWLRLANRTDVLQMVNHTIRNRARACTE